MNAVHRLMQPDLFGGVLLVEEWGRIGARVVAERYDTEALAVVALQRQAERKRRRGYGDVLSFRREACAFFTSRHSVKHSRIKG